MYYYYHYFIRPVFIPNLFQFSCDAMNPNERLERFLKRVWSHVSSVLLVPTCIWLLFTVWCKNRGKSYKPDFIFSCYIRPLVIRSWACNTWLTHLIHFSHWLVWTLYGQKYVDPCSWALYVYVGSVSSFLKDRFWCLKRCALLSSHASLRLN